MVKPTIIQMGEFDVTQKIIESLSNVCIRAILFSIKSQPKNAAQIADELALSPSTVYKILANLKDLALVVVDQCVISDDGKRIRKYKSRIGKVVITIDDATPVLNLYPNA